MFDDDFNTTWGGDWGKSTRTYANDQKASKNAHNLVLTNVPAGNYTVKRYNTWNGTIQTDPNPVKPDAAGRLEVSVGDFATDKDHAPETWDGADMLLIIE